MGNIKVAILELDNVELEGPMEYDLKSAIEYVNPTPPKKTSTNLTSSSSTVWTNVSDLSLNLIAGKSYSIRHLINHSSDTHSNGISLQLSGSAVLDSLVSIVNTMTSSTLLTAREMNSINHPVIVSAGVVTDNAKQLLIVETIVKCTTSGTLEFNFRSEVVAHIITVHSGSLVTWVEV